MMMMMVMVMMDSVAKPGDTVADGNEHRVPHAVVVEPDHHDVREDVLLQNKSPPHPPVVRGQAKVATTATAEREDDLKSRLKK